MSRLFKITCISVICFIMLSGCSSREEKGLVERRMLNGNRRSFHVFLTENGKKNQELVEEMFAEIEKDALDGISSEEFETFMEVYRKIYGNLLQAERKTEKEGKMKNE